MRDDLRTEPGTTFTFCCGGRKCPEIKLLLGGGLEITDPHAAPGTTIVFDAAMAELLRAWLTVNS